MESSMSAVSISASLTLVALAGLLVAEWRDSRTGIWITKPLAAVGYLLLALACGALDTTYGTLILIGLVLSFFGDVFLIPEGSPNAFRVGILSFLLGHVAYTIAFVGRGLDLRASAVAAVIVVVTAVIVLRWLRPHVGADMRIPVHAYVVVISGMLVCAVGTSVTSYRPDILLGALLFYLSDLAVARDRFVKPGPWNRTWGLPSYFVGQLILAAGVQS
jgi:uncharacterized membrane protein YhhN